MKIINLKRTAHFLALMILILKMNAFAQSSVPSPDNQAYLIHSRGMLHETVYNTGEIGQPTTINQTVLDIINPMMEWPPYIRPAIPTSSGTGYMTYPGQHNGYGSGVHISANYKGTTGTIALGGGVGETANRVAAACGGITGNTNRSWGQWSFPIASSFQRIENYPVLSDGTLNPAFNPNEAEEIITAKWNTNAGITVTRTSRSYSYPDYDDFIIYEYEFENTGIFFDVATSQLVHRDTTLVDVLISFVYAISPSAFGTIRHYDNTTKWQPHVTGTYTMSFWDPDYGLLYNQVASGKDSLTIAGFPEHDAANFLDWSRNEKNGGGLLSPQAAGFNVLYYDTAHLAYIDTLNGPNNQSYQYYNFRQNSSAPSNSIRNTVKGLDLDPISQKIKQPYNYFTSNASDAPSKVFGPMNDISQRLGKNQDYYANGFTYNRKSNATIPRPLILPSVFNGRAIPLDDDYAFNANYPIRTAAYGLYYLKPGDKIRFATAEMVGFGADTNKLVIGGFNSPGSGTSDSPWHPGSFWNRPVVIGGQTVTKNYVADFGLPSYVNSKVVFINDVAHKAYEAYVGHPVTKPSSWNNTNPPLMWPENNPSRGVYTVRIPIPAPAIQVENTDTNVIKISWNRNVENFENLYSSYVTGKLSKFNIYRTDLQSGPWKLVGSVNRNTVGADGLYHFYDVDRLFKVGESKYYSVTSVDSLGNESGKTNAFLHSKKIGSVPKLGKVYVVPNPYNATTGSGFSGEGASARLGLYGLPEKCTINIYSFAGQRLFTIEHNENSYSHNFEPITRNFQDYASGVYFFIVTTPNGDKSMGKFVVVK